MRMMLIAKNPLGKFNAGVREGSSEVELHPVMTPEDLGRAGLEELGKKWA
jgi:hypothetical protein